MNINHALLYCRKPQNSMANCMHIVKYTVLVTSTLSMQYACKVDESLFDIPTEK